MEVQRGLRPAPHPSQSFATKRFCISENLLGPPIIAVLTLEFELLFVVCIRRAISGPFEVNERMWFALVEPSLPRLKLMSACGLH